MKRIILSTKRIILSTNNICKGDVTTDKQIVNNAILTDSGYPIDGNTGEVIEEHGVFKSHEIIKKNKEYFKKEALRNEKIQLKLKSENKELRAITGDIKTHKDKFYSDFIWTYFRDQQILFPDLKTKDLSRLIFLSTYCDFRTNILINNGTPIKIEDLRKLMNLNRCVFNPWIDKMIELKYVKIKNDSITINKDFFSKGALKKDEDIKAIRLFIDMIQELYLNLKPDDHHKMGLVIRLIPYINPYFNCLAKNPYEKNKEQLIPLKLGELAEKLGYSQKQCKRLGNDILSIRFGSDAKRIAIAIALDDLSPRNHILMFNAKLFFGGKVDEYKIVNKIFEDYQPTGLFELDI